MIGLRIPKGSGHGFCLNLRTNFPAERKGRIEHRVTPGDSFNLTNSISDSGSGDIRMQRQNKKYF